MVAMVLVYLIHNVLKGPVGVPCLKQKVQRKLKSPSGKLLPRSLMLDSQLDPLPADVGSIDEGVLTHHQT